MPWKARVTHERISRLVVIISLFRGSCRFSEFQWRNEGKFLKEVGEIRYILKTQLKGDLFDRFFRIGQKPFRFNEYSLLDNLGRRFMVIDGEKVGQGLG